MNTLVRLAFRNTMRRRTRSLLTAGMLVFGVALMLVAVTFIGGIFDGIIVAGASMSGHVRVVTKDYLAREELAPLDAYIPNVNELAKVLAKQPGVVSVEPRVVTGVTVTVGEEIGEVFALAVGASERYFRDGQGARGKLTEGAWFSGDPEEIIVGAITAKQAEAKVGDEIVLLGTTQDGSLSPVKGRVVGIVKSGGGGLDRQVFVPLAKMQYLGDIEGGASELLVYAAEYGQATALAERLLQLPALKDLAVQPFSEREPWKSSIAGVNAVQGVIVFVVVFLTSLGIWNTMMMSVLERTHEIGVLRAMGMSRFSAVKLFVGEAAAIGVLGGAVGVLVGLYPAWLLEEHGISIGEKTAANLSMAVSETMHGRLTWEAVVMVFGFGVVAAMVGSILPAIRAASVQPVAAMSTGR